MRKGMTGVLQRPASGPGCMLHKRPAPITQSFTSTRLYSGLSETIAKSIKVTGPISIAAYMRQCLTSPQGGYYTMRDPFGREGDFTTSPEISQMFGELVAVWLLTQWLAQDRSSSVRIVELGPGRGSLLQDVLRTLQRFPGFAKAISSVQLVESSSVLKAKQKSMLCADNRACTTRWGQQVTWFESVKEVLSTSETTFVIAHEFFDALPIHQLQHTSAGWREVLVNIDPQDPEAFIARVSQKENPLSQLFPQSSQRYCHLPLGSQFEVCPEAWDCMAHVARLLHGKGGALIVDYGPLDSVPINSLRGIEKHKLVSPFRNPGNVDLSADVDFGALKECVHRADPHLKAHGPVDQAHWLHELGIGARATALSQAQKTTEAKERIASAYKRLTDKTVGSMGKIYKVMCFVPAHLPTPVGFGGKVPDPK